jgi:hypothetical protein
MSAFSVFCVFVAFVLLALGWDHYSRLQKIGWAPPVEDYKQGRSLADPIGGALGEIGRADGAHNVIGWCLDMIGTATGFAYAPIGAGLNAIGKAFELVFKPIGAALGAATGFGLRN